MHEHSERPLLHQHSFADACKELQLLQLQSSRCAWNVRSVSYPANKSKTYLLCSHSGPLNSGCGGPLVAAHSGRNPNCITTTRSVVGHRWCNRCAERDGRLVDLDTGEEVQCAQTVEPDLASIEGSLFNLTAMTVAEKSEIDRIMVGDTREVPEVFDQYRIEE